MKSSLILSLLFTLLVLLSNVKVQGALLDITKFGAKPNADSTQALMSAWKDACAAPGATGVLVPKGVFKANTVNFVGPCKGEMTFNLQGTLQAPDKIETPGWLSFKHVDKLTITGSGTLDGQGEQMWKTQPLCFKKVTACKSKAINLRLDFVNTGVLEGITSLNSKNFHINIMSCNDFIVRKVKIIAPAESPNTDGIHVARSKGVTIIDTDIGTGDDCVSVGDGTTDLKVTNVKCGPGHGISVGSLGLYPKEEPVTGITVSGCTLTNTDNGVRIKSWPDKYGCDVSGIHFSDITMTNVANPVIVDMMYCPYSKCNTKGPSKVKITDISFKGIKGTTPTPEAIKLNCMPGSCNKIELANIDLKQVGGKGVAIANCSNIKPTITGTLSPKGC